MKRLVLVLAMLSGCDAVCVDGSGDVISEEHAVDGFSGVRLEASGRMELTPSDAFAFVMRGDDNLLKRLEIFVRNGTLHVRDKDGRCMNPSDELVYEVSMPSLTSASVAGDGAVRGDAPFVAENFNLDVSGSGDLRLELQGGDVDTRISGSGDVVLSGNAARHELAISGSGNFAGFDLATASTNASISGSGDARVRASERLDVKVTGSGRLIYKGTPAVRSTISGSGSVVAAD